MDNLPKGWNYKKLDILVSKLGDGLHGTQKYSENVEYHFIKGNNIYNGNVIIKNETKKVLYEEFNKYKKQLNDRTIFVSINGTIGNVAFYNNEKVILGKSICYFNSMQREEPYQGLTSCEPLGNRRVPSGAQRQVVHGCRQLVS